MDWSRIKTIFILAFIVLNIFLLSSYKNVRSADKLEKIKTYEVADKLRKNNISYKNIINETTNERRILAKQKVFDNEKNSTNSFSNIDTSVKMVRIDMIESFNGEITAEKVNDFALNYIENGAEYRFSSFDKQNNQIIMYQAHQGRIFYNNENAKITIYLSDDQKVVYYTQKMLTDIKLIGKETKSLAPLTILANLVDKGTILPNSKIKSMKIGYFTLVTSHLIYEPTWKIEVNNGKTYYVSAIRGEVF